MIRYLSIGKAVFDGVAIATAGKNERKAWMKFNIKWKPINTLKLNIYWFVVFYINVDMLEAFVKNIFILILKREPFSFLNIFLIAMGALVAVYLMFTKKIDQRFFFLVFSYVLVYIFSILITPDIITILSTSIIRGILYVIVIVYLISLIDDYGKLLPYFIPYIYISFAYAVTHIMLRGNPLIKETAYMDFTYNTMLPMLSALAIGLYGKKATKKINRYISLTLFISLFIFNFLMGGRASILCVGICVLMLLHFQNNRRKILYTALIIGLGVLIYINYHSLLAYLTLIFPNSRTIWRMSQNIFINTSTSYRSIMWKYIIESFIKEPFEVRGFLSDRVYLATLFSSANAEGIYGYYAHNLFLEQIFQFGVFSIPFIIAGILSVIRKFNYISSKKNYCLTCFFSICMAFFVGQLMVSASYLTAKSFGIVLGLMLYMGRPRKGACYENIINL